MGNREVKSHAEAPTAGKWSGKAFNHDDTHLPLGTMLLMGRGLTFIVTRKRPHYLFNLYSVSSGK